MKSSKVQARAGFTLLETVIAIGVLAVLLTGFMVVFTPAAQGIRQSINIQQADRLSSTLEEKLVTLGEKEGTQDIKTGFDKAFYTIQRSSKPDEAVMVYQYRASLTEFRADKTPKPVVEIKGKIPGKDYIVVPTMQRLKDDNFSEDLPAVDGSVYLVKCNQLVFTKDELSIKTPGVIRKSKTDSQPVSKPEDYEEAVIAFAAEFHIMPSKATSYFITGSGASGQFKKKFESVKNPVFIRNLAVRR
jgi:prepilin-type N-terminal cleavage/methylation domain-containing protein